MTGGGGKCGRVGRRCAVAAGRYRLPAVTTPCIRPKAVCVCWRGDQLLVQPAYDAVKGETFYGLPGGGVEFGERAADAARREMHEELGAALADVTLLGVLENIFTYEGRPGHEITFVFVVRLEDEALYARDEIHATESNGQPFVARWMPLAHFAPGGPPLYPDGLFDLLGAAQSAAERRR